MPAAGFVTAAGIRRARPRPGPMFVKATLRNSKFLKVAFTDLAIGRAALSWQLIKLGLRGPFSIDTRPMCPCVPDPVVVSGSQGWHPSGHSRHREGASFALPLNTSA